jgi:hypothetical protein
MTPESRNSGATREDGKHVPAATNTHATEKNVGRGVFYEDRAALK